jgi:hypothetical protein
MKIAPYIDPNGIARARERAAYRVALIGEGDRLLIGFLPDGDGLACLEFVPIFAAALRLGTDPEEARHVVEWLSAHLEGLDAIYAPDHDPPPSYPNVVPLRAA